MDVAESLTERIPELLREHDLPGMAVGLCDRSGIIWSAGFGVTHPGGPPVTTDTIFSIQSGSKMFAGMTVVGAARDGLLDLDEPITTYLPEFTVNSVFESHPERRMTLRQLLSHTAGFTHEAPLGSNYEVGHGSFDAHCRSIADTWLRFPVGHHYEYSNLGIDLAAYALRRVSGVPFTEWVRRKVLVPRGLLRTTFDHRVIARDPDRARGHNKRVRPPVRVPMVAAGGGYTSVDDACRFVTHHLCDHDQELFRSPLRRLGSEAYGLGFVSRLANGVQLHGHAGGGFGFLSDIYWSTEHGMGVVVLTNSTDHPLQWSLCSEICADLFGVAETVAPQVNQQPNQGVEGTYIGRGDDVVDVTAGLDAQRYRLLDDGAYLETIADGSVHYRNDVPEVDAPIEEFGVRVNGRRLGTTKVRRTGDVGTIAFEDGPAIRLDRHRRDLYLSATGEALDLARTPPTYANIKLWP